MTAKAYVSSDSEARNELRVRDPVSPSVLFLLIGDFSPRVLGWH
jgi:hypothetical protein